MRKDIFWAVEIAIVVTMVNADFLTDSGYYSRLASSAMLIAQAQPTAELAALNTDSRGGTLGAISAEEAARLGVQFDPELLPTSIPADTVLAMIRENHWGSGSFGGYVNVDSDTETRFTSTTTKTVFETVTVTDPLPQKSPVKRAQ